MAEGTLDHKEWAAQVQALQEEAIAAGYLPGYPACPAGLTLQLVPEFPVEDYVRSYEKIMGEVERSSDPESDRQADGESRPAQQPEPRIRNQWFSKRLQRDVAIVEDPETGEISAIVETWMDWQKRHVIYADTMFASMAWDLSAEEKALQKLRTLVPEHMYGVYFMAGVIVEKSRRSGVTYLIRKGKPTIATGRGGEILAALCLHPIGFYDGTWAGALVPTDDVIAHLLMIRGDEHLFWRRANQHSPWEATAGIG